MSTSAGVRSVPSHSFFAVCTGAVCTMSDMTSKCRSRIALSAYDSTSTTGCARSRARSSVVKITADPESTG